jgi:hypothetical protein
MIHLALPRGNLPLIRTTDLVVGVDAALGAVVLEIPIVHAKLLLVPAVAIDLALTLAGAAMRARQCQWEDGDV